MVLEVSPGGVDKVLELVGTTTLLDSLRCAKQRGIVCMTGIVGNKWSFESFSPMDAIPTAVGLTSYAGEAEDFMVCIEIGSYCSDRQRLPQRTPFTDRLSTTIAF